MHGNDTSCLFGWVHCHFPEIGATTVISARSGTVTVPCPCPKKPGHLLQQQNAVQGLTVLPKPAKAHNEKPCIDIGKIRHNGCAVSLSETILSTYLNRAIHSTTIDMVATLFLDCVRQVSSQIYCSDFELMEPSMSTKQVENVKSTHKANQQ